MSYHIPLYKISLTRNGSVCAESRPRISTTDDLYLLLREYFAHHDREEMIALLLDMKNKIIGINSISIGTLTLSLVHPRETFKAAILANAAKIILAHNHPSGDATPSSDDRDLTERLRRAGDILSIPVMDHLVIGEEGGTRPFVSFLAEGWLQKGKGRIMSGASGAAKIRISLYMPCELLRLIEERLPTGALDESQGRSEWIRDACRRRLQAELKPDTMAKEEPS